MNYVGIDHHRQYLHMMLMDEQGNNVRSRKVSNLRSEVEGFLEGVKDCCAVIEAGRSSYTLVPEVYQRSKENREVQKVLRQKVFYVEAMTRVKNRIQALIAQQREEVRQETTALVEEV